MRRYYDNISGERMYCSNTWIQYTGCYGDMIIRTKQNIYKYKNSNNNNRADKILYPRKCGIFHWMNQWRNNIHNGTSDRISSACLTRYSVSKSQACAICCIDSVFWSANLTSLLLSIRFRMRQHHFYCEFECKLISSHQALLFKWNGLTCATSTCDRGNHHWFTRSIAPRFLYPLHFIDIFAISPIVLRSQIPRYAILFEYGVRVWKCGKHSIWLSPHRYWV